MKLTRERQGELFIFGEATLWALFPVITLITYSKISPLISLSLSTFFAAIFFAIMLLLKKKWHEVLNKSAFKNILWATFFIGILYYLFIFFGLQYTSAGNVSIITKAEILFSFLLFNVWKKDNMPLHHIAGSIFMIIGAIIVLYPNLHIFQPGDILILIASTFPPFGNYFTRKAREKVSSEIIMFIRSIISAVVVLLLAIAFNNKFTIPSITDMLPFLAINGIFLLGLSKVLWIEGIHRISVVKANALGSLSPLLTLLFAWTLLGSKPTSWQLFSFIPMFLGIILLSKNNNKQE